MSKNNPQFNGCLLVLKNMEEVLGVYNLVPSLNQTSELLPINQYLNIIPKYLQSCKGRDKLELLSKSGYFLTTLCFLKSICSFNRISILDFSEVTRVDALAQLLIPYLKRENITEEIENNKIFIQQYLRFLETKNSNFINSMSYRYLRLFTTLAYARYFKLASIVADFIIDQIFIGEDLDNSVRQKLDELMDARKYVETIGAEYGVTPVSEEVSKEDKQSKENIVSKVVNLAKPNNIENKVNDVMSKVDVATTIPPKGDKQDLSKLVTQWNKNVETPILTNKKPIPKLSKDTPKVLGAFGKIKHSGDDKSE